MDSSVVILVVLFLVIILGWLIFDLRKKIEKGGDKDSGEKIAVILDRLKALSVQNSELRQELDSKLSQTHQATQDQINTTIKTVQGITGQSAKQIADVVAGLVKLEETNKQVINFSTQLQNLQDILKNPKQRGVLGEYFLKETLCNVLPPNSYQMQYGFKDGSIVDAVIFVDDQIIPVDSKFSLENYERILNAKTAEEREPLEKLFKQDLKNRIDETSKYIKPEENTTDFAFMFIPSEAIYYDLLVNKVGAVQISTRDLIDYAFRDKKVVIVSPTSFLAYLQTVLHGMKKQEMEKGIKQVIVNVEKLNKHLINYEDFMKKLGGSIGTTVNHYNSASKEFLKINKDVAKITESENKFEPMLLDKPHE
jgi:DNA recombination protein RmuC